ncbi:Rieske (2Fe-2S) protein [Nocardia alni]|uniref:Rieske (2Fe-2S) protein n=1 Tax=Nocardia alni TaxID=2815723 RepID=UPI001C23E6A4|nr:Rieske (2Fe-2S) protein [Nocardia alni]
MNARGIRRYVRELLNGQRPRGFAPDDAEAEQMRVAIALRAARLGSSTPSEEFLTGLRQRLAEEFGESGPAPTAAPAPPRRRQVIIGTSIAAAAATVGGVVDHAFVPGPASRSSAQAQQVPAEQTLVPGDGVWRAVAASASVPEGSTVAFDLGTVNGFVHRRDGIVYALSGICTHQGCKLWLDGPDERLRCPCHATSFGIDGAVLTHQLPISPAPLPRFEIRETNGAIEVFAPAAPA